MKRENVWDYPRPPRVESVPAILRIVFAGRTIATTRDAKRVLETSHPPAYYLPRTSFDCEILPSRRTSVCEWKGRASYWAFRDGGRVANDCAWSYTSPAPGFEAIRDHLSVYPEAMDACFVDEEMVTPQPGDFYGGWVTSHLDGPLKGGPGTLGW